MIQRLVISAERIHQELADLEQVITRVERGMAAGQQRPEDLDLYLDAVALNIHDFYTGLERIFRHIAATVDGSVPEIRPGTNRTPGSSSAPRIREGARRTSELCGFLGSFGRCRC